MRLDKSLTIKLIAALIVFAAIFAVGRSYASDYDDAYRIAAKSNKPLIVFVAVEVRTVPGCISVSVDSLNGNAKPRIVVGKTDATGDSALLDATATDAEIRAAVRQGEAVAAPKGGQASGDPFARREGQAESPVGGDEPVPTHLTLFADMEVYTSATMTQQSFRRWSGFIQPVSRLRLEARWRVPGGLVGVRGWRSTLYRSKVRQVSIRLGRTDPNDGSSQVTWKRQYTADVQFADVLRNQDGKVFEVRVASKESGEWSRFVAYRDVSARPHGYAPIKSGECASCHSQAGANSYGAEAIPGDDTVLSDAIEPLENGRVVQGGFGENLR